MLKQESGAIVNCSSIGGLVGGAKRGTYQASKHGVLGLTKSAALDYAARGIRINAVCPGIIHTSMLDKMMATQADALNAMLKDVPIGRLGRPEEIASAVRCWRQAQTAWMRWSWQKPPYKGEDFWSAL